MIGLSIQPDFKRKHRLGMKKIDGNGDKFKYAKIDFGSMGKDLTGKRHRNICYSWIMYK